MNDLAQAPLSKRKGEEDLPSGRASKIAKAVPDAPSAAVNGTNTDDKSYHEHLADLVAARVALDTAQQELDLAEDSLKHVKSKFSSFSALVETQANTLRIAQKNLVERKASYRRILDSDLCVLPADGRQEENALLKAQVAELDHQVQTQKKLADDQSKVLEEQDKTIKTMQAALARLTRDMDNVPTKDSVPTKDNFEASFHEASARLDKYERLIPNEAWEERFVKLQEQVDNQERRPRVDTLGEERTSESDISLIEKYVDDVIAHFEAEISANMGALRAELAQLGEEVRKSRSEPVFTSQPWANRVSNGRRLEDVPIGPERAQAHAGNLDSAINDLLDMSDNHVRLIQDLTMDNINKSSNALPQPQPLSPSTAPGSNADTTALQAGLLSCRQHTVQLTQTLQHQLTASLQTFGRNLFQQLQKEMLGALPPPEGPESFHCIRKRMTAVEILANDVSGRLVRAQSDWQRLNASVEQLNRSMSDSMNSNAVATEILRSRLNSAEDKLNGITKTMTDKVNVVDLIETIESQQFNWGVEVRLIHDVVSEGRKAASLAAVDWEKAAEKIKAGLAEEEEEG